MVLQIALYIAVPLAFGLSVELAFALVGARARKDATGRRPASGALLWANAVQLAVAGALWSLLVVAWAVGGGAFGEPRPWWSALWQLPDAALDGPGLLVALSGLGLAIGVLTGIFGVGGGFLVVPMLMVLYGIEESIAVGTSICFVIGTSAAGARRHMRVGNYESRTVFLLAGGAVCGALLGTQLHLALKAALAGNEVINFQAAMRCLYLPLLLTTAWLVFRGASEREGGKSLLQRLPLGPRTTLAGGMLAGVSLPGLLAVGLGVGVLTGLLGIGGGVLFMPILLLVVGLSVHHAVGTSLGVVLFSAPAAAVRYGAAGSVSLSTALALLVTSTLGVQLGGWICDRLHASSLQRYFALIVLAAAIVVATDLVLMVLN